MKKLIILWLSAGCFAWAAVCTSAANGNWSSPASWSNCNGSFPGDGDTVTITHNITVDVNATVGNSPLDTAAAAPATWVMLLQRTNGTTSNGQLTVSSGVTFTVKGSVGVTGSGSYAPIITLQPGSTWTFDNSANPTAVYRIQSTTAQTYTYINAPGTGWGAGGYITINGRPPACSSCTGAMWANEADVPVKGGKYSSFKHNYSYVKFWYLGSPTDAYRSIHFNCYDGDHQAGQQMYMLNVEWHNSTGFTAGGSSGYPCSYTDFKIQYMKTLDSPIVAAGWLGFYPVGTPTTGKSRTLQYVYLDRGFFSNGGNATLHGFQTASYIVADGQRGPFGPGPSWPGTNVPNTDHILVRYTANGGDSFFFGSASYWLTVIDGGVGNVHTVMTRNLSSAYNWVIDHAIWQHGDATGSADTDAYEMVAGTGMTASWNYLLMLPNAADPRYTSHTVNTWAATGAIWSRYNHATFAFGNNYSGSGLLMGSIYTGEGTGCGAAGAIGIRNSVLWNPNPTPQNSPVYADTSTNCPDNSFVANHFDPTQIHHNLVWNYGTNSTRWTSSKTPCGGVDCTSKGTPYDYPMTGTVPGAADIYAAPRFVWQAQGIKAPGPREWANIKHNADITTGETPTQVHFGTTFALFRDAVISDTTTPAGMKGLIDEMFAWIYGEWSSTNPALKGTADDGSDIGAAPVTLLCPGAYPASIVSGCNTIADAGVRSTDPGDGAPLESAAAFIR